MIIADEATPARFFPWKVVSLCAFLDKTRPADANNFFADLSAFHAGMTGFAGLLIKIRIQSSEE